MDDSFHQSIFSPSQSVIAITRVPYFLVESEAVQNAFTKRLEEDPRLRDELLNSLAHVRKNPCTCDNDRFVSD
jgi:hypothetical protein